MNTCTFCGATDLTWHENLRCFVSEITGRKHGYNLCLIKIPRFETVGTTSFYRRPESIAHDIVNKCVAVGKDPNKVQVQREGEFLIIK